MNQSTHLGLEEILSYVHGDLPAGESQLVERHFKDCLECFEFLLIALEFQQAESIGLFNDWPDEDPASKTPDPIPSTGKLFGIGGAIVGLGGLLKGFSHPSFHSVFNPAASLAASGHQGTFTGSGNEINSPFGARNSPDPASSHPDAHHSIGDEDIGGGHHMPTIQDSGFHQADTAYGLPEIPGQSDHVQQNYADTCAVQCQRLILNEFGYGVTEKDLAREASQMGIYTPGDGTQLEDVGKLLEAHGIPVHREMNANVFNLATELAEGHKVMVGLNSGELWHANSLLDSIANALGIAGADHAVIVSGIDTQNPDHVHVIVTDPGTGDIAKSYPLEEFLDAWKGSHFSLIATTVPAPPIDPGMVNFDYQAGHISHVGAMPYDLAHDLSTAAQQEHDPSVLHNLENAFMHFVSGNEGTANILASLPHLGNAGGVAGMIHTLAGMSHGQPASHDISSALSALGQGHMGDWFHSLFDDSHSHGTYGQSHAFDPAQFAEHHDPYHDTFDHHDDSDHSDFDDYSDFDSGVDHD